MSQVSLEPNLASDNGIPFYGYQENVAPADPEYQEYHSFDLPAATLAAPVAEPEPTQLEINVDQSEFSTPELLTEPPPGIDSDSDPEPEPYVEPRFNMAPPEINGVAVPELDADTGFLSPQGLSNSEDEIATEDSNEEPTADENPSDFDSVLEPAQAESFGKNILQSNDKVEVAQVIVLKAQPVMNHKVNNQGVLRPGEAMATNRTDYYGLPVNNTSVQFAELPPLDNGTRPRPVSFQRTAKPMPPVKHIDEVEHEVEPKDKTTASEQGNLHVVESTTRQPSDREPILRMTAIPYEGTSTLGAAIARIKVGRAPLIVRGEYPRDLEYERLARERNEQAARSVIIPSTSLKTIDR